MITFWVPAFDAFEPKEYLEGRGQPLADRITVRTYQWDHEDLVVSAGPQIFAGLDRLTEPERHGVVDLQRQLASVAPGTLMLNDPARSLRRRALLETLAARRINQFRIYPADQIGSIQRFPVFVRGESDHEGSLTGLLHSRGEVNRAVRALRFRGRRLSELLIVEFCDTSDGRGLFRKYAAFRVGDAIVPAHVLRGPHWVLKSEGSDRTMDGVKEDLAFVEQNPHEQWLREIFTLAGIEYGRMDYGILGAVPQVWEINLNPTLTRRPGKSPLALDPAVAEIRDRARSLAHRKLREAFTALDTAEPSRSHTLHVTAEIRAAVASATRQRRRRHAMVELLRRSYESPFGAPLRALLPHNPRP